MKYQKPELLQLGSAMKAVQDPENKENPQVLDNRELQLYGSAAAYAADE